MTNTYQQMSNIIEALQSEGKEVTVIKLPSAARRTRKSLWGVKKPGSRRRCGKAQMQDCNKIYHSSGHQ